MTKIKKYVDRVAEVLCVALLGIMTLLVTYQVVVRYLFNSPSAYSEVLSRYMFIWLVLIGTAYVFGQRNHMNITFLKDKLPRKIRLITEIIGELLIALFASGIMFYGGYTSSLKQMKQMDSALQIPMGLIYAAIPISGFLIIFYFIYNESQLIKDLISKEETL